MSVLVFYHPDFSIAVDFTAMVELGGFGWITAHLPVGNGPTDINLANDSLGHLVHFTGPIIPHNAIISNAFFKTSFWGVGGGLPPWGAGANATGKISANKALTLTAPGDFAAYQALVRTPTVVTWFPIALAGGFFQIPSTAPQLISFAHCIQDVISAVGNNGELTLFLEDDGSPPSDIRYFYHDPVTSFLHIEYNVPVPAVPSSFKKKLFVTGAI